MRGESDGMTTITMVCAWCGKPLGTKDGNGQTGVSHGICSECKAKLLIEHASQNTHSMKEEI
jgi:hypothetical protein